MTPFIEIVQVDVLVPIASDDGDRKRLYYTKDEDIRLLVKRNLMLASFVQIRDTYASGRCDKQLMEQALELYHSRYGHQFMYVHWWEDVGESQWWKIHLYTEGDGTKRTTPVPTENAQHPPGCKDAKKAKGKDKEAATEVNIMKEQIGAFRQAQADAKLQNEEMTELQSRLSAQKVEASQLAYEAAKERPVAKLAEERTKLFDKFTEMLNADTTKPWAKEMHMKAVTRFGGGCQLFTEE
uniref:No apical meristem-associated C-terminal domain-containing protein n=1 Tax=Aegilops tauschii TaxID=37682 RepID=M8C243_AEGTA